ncbi:MAG: hypothetical protein IT388_11950 [Nitrospirales bacterium]|nr:hypothetical protein [Nitrospirales bacterium]
MMVDLRIFTYKEWLHKVPEKGKKCRHDGQHCIKRDEPACYQCWEQYMTGQLPGRRSKC